MIIDIKNVSIRYIIGDFKDIGLKEYVVRKIKRNFTVQEFWAVDDVTFSLEKAICLELWELMVQVSLLC